MASEVTALRGKSPNGTRQAAAQHVVGTVSAGQLVVVGVAGYSDLDPTDALTAGDLTQVAGTATLSAWQLHRTDKRDAGSVEVDTAIYSARVLTGGTLTVQINKAVDRYWTPGSTVFNGNWDDNRQIAVNGRQQVDPNTLAASPGGVNAQTGDVIIGMFGHNSSGGSATVTLGAGYSTAWVEPNASLYCVGGMATRIADANLTATEPVWTFSDGLATNGGVASSVVVLREGAPPDTTPPTLTTPTGTKTGSTTGAGTVSTNEANGTLYYLVSTSPSATGTAVKAGGNQVVTNSGNQAVTFSDLAPSTTYYPHYLHRDAAGNDSAVATGASFTTDAPPPPPTLTSPTRTSIQASSVSVGATSDLGGAGHAFHVAVGTSASAPTGAQIEAGSGGTIVAAATGALSVGANSLTVSGLSPNTTYYPYAVAENASGYSNVVVGASFTTPALSPVITGVSSMTPARGASLTITGTNFGATQGTREVRINGVIQTVTAWGDTSITVTVVRGATLYGQGVNVVIFEGGSAISNSFAITGLLPQAGWSYLVAGTPNTTAADRITAVADITAGDQVAYDTKGGLVVLNQDLTFQSQEAVTDFEVEVGNADGWGAVALQTVGSPVIVPKGVVGVIALFL